MVVSSAAESEYAASYPSASIIFKPSDMRLFVPSDASYLSETKSRSRAGGFFFLGNNGESGYDSLNGGLGSLSQIIPMVVSRLQSTAMRFHWIQDRIALGQFVVLWGAGVSNLGDFFTKILPSNHHRLRRKWYVTDVINDTNDIPGSLKRKKYRVKRG